MEKLYEKSPLLEKTPNLALLKWMYMSQQKKAPKKTSLWIGKR